MRRLILAVLLGIISVEAQNLMPWPAEVAMGQGSLPVTPSLGVTISGPPDAVTQQAVSRFLARLEKRTGVARIGAEGAGLQIRVNGPARNPQTIDDDESYSLRVTGSGAVLEAPTPLGVVRGLATLLQLVNGRSIPATTIVDRPRYKWRGLMLEVCRHFMPYEVVLRQLDAMELMKLNVFHWHLSDDQGIRVESKLFPRLQAVGSEGKFYTQDEIRQLVEYARLRGIRVVPEFDMPGHTSAILAAYPNLASGPGPIPVAKTWTMLSPTMDPTRDEVYDWIAKFLGEMTTLFPDAYLHMGGDEVNGKMWRVNPSIQEFQSSAGLGGKAGLHAYFNKRLSDIIVRLNRTMVGWDEILHPDLPRTTVVQSWRGQSSLARAESEGYSGILSNGFYLDHMKSAAHHYANDPGDAPKLLGGEACMWAEYVTPDNLDMRLWPRMAAIAERLWSPYNVRDIDAMYVRLQATSAFLAHMGLQHEAQRITMLNHLAGKHPIEPLITLTNALEPVKMYARSTSRAYTTVTPMKRLVDATPPESLPARSFTQTVDAILGGNAEARKTAQTMLLQWRDNHAKVLPILQSNPLLTEIVPEADYVRDVASAGLQALKARETSARLSLEDYTRFAKLLSTDGKRNPPVATRAACTSVLMQYGRRRSTVARQCAEPRYLAEVVPVIVEPVRKLVESVRPENAPIISAAPARTATGKRKTTRATKKTIASVR